MLDITRVEKSPTWISDFKSNVFSQNGEDGIILKILEILPENDKWCVEFGAGDGEYLSNTYNLIKHHGYSAVLIEEEKNKFESLRKRHLANEKVTCLRKMVGFTEENNLGRLLQHTLIPHHFDFLSIDIDGNDYHVWQKFDVYKPKIVCIEFNPTIPTEVDFIQPRDISLHQGSSLRSLVELGKAKGYELIAVLRVNAFFVESQYYSLFNISDNHPKTLRMDLNDITYLFTAYDGKVFLRGSRKLPWHHLTFNESKVQQLPNFLRVFPGNYGIIRRMLFRLYRKLRQFIASCDAP